MKVDKKSLHTCLACGIFSDRVEASGIWFCPNLICTGSGAAWFRARCESYEEDGWTHTLSPSDWLRCAEKYVDSSENKYGDVIMWHDAFEKIIKESYGPRRD